MEQKEIIICGECGFRFPVNLEKHKYRNVRYCPNCHSELEVKESIELPVPSLKTIQTKIQQIFRGLTKPKSKKTVSYVCPECKTFYVEAPLQRVPDKWDRVDGKLVAVSWKLVPVCRECGTFLVRKVTKSA